MNRDIVKILELCDKNNMNDEIYCYVCKLLFKFTKNKNVYWTEDIIFCALERFYNNLERIDSLYDKNKSSYKTYIYRWVYKYFRECSKDVYIYNTTFLKEKYNIYVNADDEEEE